MENNVTDKFLPVGTVVLLKGANKRLMITGFCTIPSSAEEKKVYDYSGCLFPEGILTSDKTALFNHDMIEKIYHLGLKDEEEENFKKKLNKYISEKGINNLDSHNTVVDTDNLSSNDVI